MTHEKLSGKEKRMRFMMLMIPKVYQGEEGRQAGAGYAPAAEAVERMMAYNEELAKAGALIALDGLRPPVDGARVSFSGGKTIVTDGPFAESKEVLGGYWVIDAASREEAVAWARRCPAEDGDVVEVRQVFETSDFPPEARRAAENPVVREQVKK
jgi:hypothetical protein